MTGEEREGKRESKEGADARRRTDDVGDVERRQEEVVVVTGESQVLLQPSNSSISDVGACEKKLVSSRWRGRERGERTHGR
jgi:hypothetical protein